MLNLNGKFEQEMKNLRERLAILRKVNQAYERQKGTCDVNKNAELAEKVKQLEGENKKLSKSLKEAMQNQAEVSITNIYK